LLVPLLLLVACDGRQADAEPHGRVSVVAAFYPLRWLAEELGGAAVDVTTLTPAGVEPHDLTLPPDSVREVESADVVLYLGEGFQPDVERAVANLGGDVEAVDLLDAEGVDLLPAPGDLGKEPLAGGEDPHVWLDPVRFSAMAEAAAGALVAADPELEATVDANLERVRADLADLDGELAAALGGCADGTILTSHAAFGYLADRYGLEQLAIAGISPEAEPDARTLAEITRSARERGVETVFFEEALPPDLSRTVADEIGAEIALLGALEFDPEEAIGAGEDYLSVMAANGEAIAEGLSCR
jgi:zinc transport system substrate-binding protein